MSATFVVLARSLGPATFGTFSGTLALVVSTTPIAALGAGHVMIRRLACDDTKEGPVPAEAFGLAGVGVVASTIIVFAAARVLSVDSPLWLIGLLVISELALGTLTELLASLLQARERLDKASLVRVSTPLLRLIAVTLATSLGELNLVHAGLSYTIAAALSIWIAALVVRPHLQRPLTIRPPDRSMILEGMSFTLGIASFGVQDDIDKSIMLARASPSDTGLYAAAYRFLNLAMAAVRALNTATYSSFFRFGRAAPDGAFRYMFRLLGRAVAGVGFLCGLIFVSAGALPLLLGPSFGPAVDIVRWLALLPLIRLLQYLPANALTASGHRWLRSCLQSATAVLNILLNLAWIPSQSYRGAVRATYVAEASYLIAVWLTSAWIWRRSRRACEEYVA